MPFHYRAHSHTYPHSDWDKLDTTTHFMCTALGCGRKLESPEEAHAGVERTCKLHRGSGPGQESVLFLTNTITERYYSRTYCTIYDVATVQFLPTAKTLLRLLIVGF